MLTGGGCFLPALLSAKFSDVDVAVYGILTLIFGALFYLCLFTALKVRAAAQARREECAKESRQAMFTLPDKENSFVRDRLNTALRANADEEITPKKNYDMEEGICSLNHVRDMLGKLKTTPLTPGDRLEAEGISRMLTLYATKNRLTAKEVRELNDCLASILKMIAKYGV